MSTPFERLKVVRLIGSWPFKVAVCQCDCGKTLQVAVKHLVSGHTRSCGCLSCEQCGTLRRRHGMWNTPEFWIWHSMKQRCLNPNTEGYHLYGGRGIQVCDRWLDFANFITDMGQRPSSKHTIERNNSDGDYEPSNCRWATTKEQARNRSTNRKFTMDAQTLCLTDWATRTGIKFQTLKQRLDKGLTIEQAINWHKHAKGQSLTHRQD